MKTWHLGHRPGLDGLRGVAVSLVVAAHIGIRALWPLGSAGVTVFFTLSGFLITALLLGEHNNAGRISMRGFYGRRVRRLVPAFVLLLAVVWPLEVVLRGGIPYPWATLIEVNNWISATRGPAALDLLHHTWSLAIEEQFYLVWPITLAVGAARFGRRGVVTLAGLGIVASLVMAALTDGDRLAFGTDTNASSLFVGCLLAASMVDRRVWVAPTYAMPLAGTLAAGGIIAGWWPEHVLVPAATALAIWSLSTRDSRILEWIPLQGAGRISYGWYLWNYPVALLMADTGGPMLAVPAVSLLLALASWRWVEQPALRPKGQEADSVSAPAATVMVVAVTDVVSAPPTP